MTILVLTGSGFLIRNSRIAVTMEEVEKIHHKALTIDSHTDTPFFLTDEGFDFSGRNGNETGIASIYPKCRKGAWMPYFSQFLSGSAPATIR